MSGLLMRHAWPLALMRSAGTGPIERDVLGIWIENQEGVKFRPRA